MEKTDENIIQLIKKSKIFSKVEEGTLRQLLPLFEKITLSTGDLLFEQGTPSDSLYILIDGYLIAILNTAKGKQKVIGAIDRGETVGELGALSNQPRSLTVKATTDCHLLKLTRAHFEEFAKDHPSVMFNVIDLIIARSQNTIRFFSRKKIYKHIAIIKGHDEAEVQVFMSKLKLNSYLHPNVDLLEEVPVSLNLSEQIDEAERKGRILIFYLKPENLPSLEDRLNHIGEIFVLVNGDSHTKLSDFALSLLGTGKMPITAQPELVVLHPNETEPPRNTMHWLQQASFTLHHHLLIDDNLDYQRILRIMTGKAIGLVLGGGGNKGWVCIGVLKALLEAKIPIDIIGGTSVGALVGAAYAMTYSYKKTFDIFNELTQITNRPFQFKHFTWPLISLLSSKLPTEALQRIFGEVRIEDMWLPFFSVSCNLTTGKEVLHTHGTIWDKLRATMAIPGIVPPMVIDGQLYIDGGILNNLPVDQLHSLVGSEATAIAVSLTEGVEDKKYYNFPPALPFRVGLLKKLRLRYKDYVFPPFFNTFIDSLLLGSSAKEKSNRLLADIVISPNLKRYKPFQINTKQINTLIEIGYKTTKQELAACNLFSLNENSD